ncbi:ATP-dependent helicase [Devosia rhizoryzae]|uniref:DNA 3'-5' helicase n=1 Tax=Devosia rhizoryzae TaxID=2774137 RepID=A0ABX7C6X9_9HYPH|nr:ATP-dependent helicase [Devosia rhizoryzae]QQR39014.1 UvrD-helicase domain-containing protein [Devosia rhizoryzae]
MDAVEVARRRGAEINAELIAGGADIRMPYQLALAAAARAGVEVQRVDKGSAMLNGARAIYDPDMPLIAHETTGSEFDDAFLVAHEVGHVELGDRTQRYETTDVDASRPAEMPPVGAERVEDYSRRQRREVQMDLFARELLLPRATAKALHIDGGMTSVDLATHIGAPRAVVVQQLLDALLLPVVEAERQKENIERPLNDQQRAAAEHLGNAYLLEAGPGTGKTQTLVGRVAFLLSKGVDPRGILVLTFSNRAAGELFERIAEVDPEAAAAMWIGTFHSFGLDLVRRFHDLLGLPDDPKMIDRADAIGLLEAEAPRLELKHYKNLWDPTDNLDRILAAISRAKDELATPQDYAILADAMLAAAGGDDDLRIAAEKQIEVAGVYRRYEEMKGASQRLDFGDLVTLPVKLLTEHEDVRSALSEDYAHILVDEYQDVNRSSVALLKLLRPTGQHLWAVGDAKQSIYRFRGASSVNLGNFAVDFAGAEGGRLIVNYRSGEEIVETFSRFAATMNVAKGKDSGLVAQRGRLGHPPEHCQVDYAADEIEAVAEAIEAFRKDGIDYRDQAILCTGNDKLAKIGAALETLGIPVLHLGSIFERSEVKDLLSLLSILVDKRAMGIVRAAAMPQFQMSIGDVSLVVQSLAAGSTTDQIWNPSPEQLPDLTAPGRAALGALGVALHGFDEKSYPSEVLATLLLDRTRIAADLASQTTISSRAKSIAIWQLMNFVRNPAPGSGAPISSLLDRIRRLVRLADDRDLRQLPTAAQKLDAVRLMTIHGSKGLEFRAVHFPGANNTTIPSTPNRFQGVETPNGLVRDLSGTGKELRVKAHVDEQECLFYVAMSRAKDRLAIYTPTMKKGGTKWGHSEFLDRIVPPMRRHRVDPAIELVQADDSLVDIVFDGSVSFAATRLATHASCPRRFYYSHLLGVGGKRTETTFMKMHDAVQAVVDWVVAMEPHEVSSEEVAQRLSGALEATGVSASGYAAEYRGIAQSLVDRLIASRAGMTKLEDPGLRHAAAAASIDIRVDELLRTPEGGILVRRVKTGQTVKSALSDLSTISMFLAAKDAFPTSTIQIVHLAEDEPVTIEIEPKKWAARRQEVDDVLSTIVAGDLPLDRTGRPCPKCPSFFICGTLPEGTLVKKV